MLGGKKHKVMEPLLDKVLEQPLKKDIAVAYNFPETQLMHTRFTMTKRIATKQNTDIFLVI